MPAMPLDLTQDAVSLTRDLVDIESVSGNEAAIADAIEAAFDGLEHLTVKRFGHTLVAVAVKPGCLSIARTL